MGRVRRGPVCRVFVHKAFGFAIPLSLLPRAAEAVR
jgi:hypothetical protein